MRAFFVALVFCGCSRKSTPPPIESVKSESVPVPSSVPPQSVRCPKPDKSLLTTESDPPWERDPLGPWPSCLETADGARAYQEKDTTDVDGWRVFLIVDDAKGRRFKLPTRAFSAMNIGPDGSFYLAHTEPMASRISDKGVVLWSTPHPKCGSPEVAVGWDGTMVMGCGYSVVAFGDTGKLLFQKWPLGNVRIRKPWLAKDGSMIVSGDGEIALLDANGDVRTKLSTGGNRYVHPMGVLPTGDLVARTSMAAMHSDGPIHMYYPHEPDELFVVSRAGKLVSRTQAEPKPKEWPKTLEFTVDLRAGRLPP